MYFKCGRGRVETGILGLASHHDNRQHDKKSKVGWITLIFLKAFKPLTKVPSFSLSL